jgi:hypothetical protein
MTRAELKTLMWSWVDDPDGGYFTDANLNTWLNNAQKHVQRQLIQSGELYYAQEVQTTLVANTQEYSLPTDYLRHHRMELIVSGTYPNENRSLLRQMTPVQATNFATGTGQPGAYYLKKDSFVLLKTPSQAWQLALIYSYLIADMTSDSDVPDVPTQYHEYIAVVATIDAFLKDQRDITNLNEKVKYYEGLMKQDAQNRAVDMPREVVVTESDNTYWAW